MVRTFGMMVGVGLVASLVSAPPADARKRLRTQPPCPLTATLRVADPASLIGIQTLSQCTQVVVAPAMPGEEPSSPDVRIAPEPEAPGRARAAIHLTSAAAGGNSFAVPSREAPVESGRLRMRKIAPQADEIEATPAEMPATAALPASSELPSAIDPESILAMGPISYSTRYDSMIKRVAARHRIDPLLLHAVIDQESRYQAHATSHAGARGLMQLMPGTARMLNVHGGAIVDAEANVDGGARLLRRLHGRFNDFALTLAAYNAGEGAVRKYGNAVPPYRETQVYVRKVLARYNKLVAEQGSGHR